MWLSSASKVAQCKGVMNRKNNRVQCDHLLGAETDIVIACYVNVTTAKNMLFQFTNDNNNLFQNIVRVKRTILS